ncbi:hypothetical protein OHB56_13005 [Streptomyces sp. NBC_01635]|uniref:hypothetical protein n=1 Tax=Streptomyces sp. NBC_01635 TaxID=2975904 RepID=UPI00386C31E3|nr:hypothetical protein OHB56_13005 [Streptomyces sp. NBC_01635]
MTPRAAGPTDATKERAALNRPALGVELIAFGRGFLTNPDFVERPRTDIRLSPPQEIGLYAGDHRGYTDYPTLDEPDEPDEQTVAAPPYRPWTGRRSAART